MAQQPVSSCLKKEEVWVLCSYCGILLLLLLLLSRFSRVRLCATPETAAHQAPLSLGFSRQEHWSGLPFPSQCIEVKSESEVAQSCLTLSDPMDCSPPGSPRPWDFPGRSTGVGCQWHLMWPRNRAMFEGPIRSAFSDMEQKIKTRGSLSKANNIHSYLTKCLGWVLVGISNMPGLYLVVAEWLPELLASRPHSRQGKKQAGSLGET